MSDSSSSSKTNGKTNSKTNRKTDSKTDSKTKHKINKKANRKTKINPNNSPLEPNLNITTTHPSKQAPEQEEQYKCIVCNTSVPSAKRKKNFRGHPHKQTATLLQACRDSTKPPSDALKVTKDKYHCYLCGESVLPPHSAENLQGHLTKPNHVKNLEALWDGFVELAKGMARLGRDEIPRDMEKTFYKVSEGEGGGRDD